MQYVPALDTFHVELNYTLHGEPIQNNLYFFYGAGSPGQAEADTLENALSTWFTNKLATRLSGDIVLNEIYMTDLTTQSSPTYGYTKAIAGTSPGPGLPGNVCICVSFRTPGRGRSSRGRNYVSGISENDVIGNKLNAVPLTNIRDDYSDLITDISATGWLWVVLSRVTGGQPRPTALVQEVTSVKIVDQVLDSQRGRLV